MLMKRQFVAAGGYPKTKGGILPQLQNQFILFLLHSENSVRLKRQSLFSPALLHLGGSTP